MRTTYDLHAGSQNPYAARIGARGRAVLLARFMRAEKLVRLDDDVASVFGDARSVNAALRLVMRLRNVGAKAKRPRRAA